MLEKFPLDKINGIKNALFFLSRAPTHVSFNLNLEVSLKLYGIFNFRFRFFFI